MLNIQSLTSMVMQIGGAGGGVWVVTQLSKVLLLTKLDGDQTAKVRAIAGVLSAVAVGLLGIVNQNLQPSDLTHIGMAAAAFASTWGVSHGFHKLVNPTVFKKGEVVSPPTEPTS